MIATDTLLIRATLSSADKLGEFAAQVSRALPAELLISTLQLGHEPTTQVVYVYAHLSMATTVEKSVATTIEKAMSMRFSDLKNIRVSRLQKVFDVAGASRGQLANFHYVVETDANEGWFTELGEWYDKEHMPGLAAVPGCIHAARYLNHDHGPRSHACYALESAEAKGSPPWMVMTNSEWSSRVRPHFTNTIRTMFQVIPVAKDRSA